MSLPGGAMPAGKLSGPLLVASDVGADYDIFPVKRQHAIVRLTIAKLVGTISLHIRIRARWLFCGALALFTFSAMLFPHDAGAGIASGFSLLLGEQYNDNILFEKDKEPDFITLIAPTFSVWYSPPGQTTPIFTADLIPVGQLFARHSNESNFGDNVALKTTYTYYHSPRFTLSAGDTLSHLGQTRVLSGGLSKLQSTGLPLLGAKVANPFFQSQGDFLSNGKAINNHFFLRGEFNYNSKIDFVGYFSAGYTRFLDQSGSDLSQDVGVRGVYKWNNEHNPHFGYSIRFIKSHDGHRNIVHRIDIGDDFFSSAKIRLDPTLTLSATTGIDLNTGGDGPAVTNSTSITLTKVWEAASLKAGVSRELTPSFGVAGISNTTRFFSEFRTRITERLSGFASVNYSLFDTKEVNFNTFEAFSGVAYWLTRWLSANFYYAHVWTDSGSGAASTDLLTSGKIDSNTVGLVFTVNFNIWPSFSLAQAPALP